MDIILTVLLFVCALCMVFGKPFRIEIMHKYPEVKVLDKSEDEQKKLDEQEVTNMDAVIKSINEIMGVEINGDNYNPT